MFTIKVVSMRYYILLIFLSVLFIQCGSESSAKEQKTIPVKTVVEKPEVEKKQVKEVPKKIETDTINDKNKVESELEKLKKELRVYEKQEKKLQDKN